MEGDPLRSRLQEMTERLMSLEEIVAVEAERKKTTAEQQLKVMNRTCGYYIEVVGDCIRFGSTRTITKQ